MTPVAITELSAGFLFYYFNIVCLTIYRLIFSGKKHKQIFLFMAGLHLFIILAVRSNEVGMDSWGQYPYVFFESSRITFMDLVSRWSYFKQMRLFAWGGNLDT